MRDRIRALLLIVGIAFIAGAVETGDLWRGILLAVVGGALVGIWEAWFRDDVVRR